MDGLIQFFVQAGMHSCPLGAHHFSIHQTTESVYGWVPVLLNSPADNFSIEAGSTCRLWSVTDTFI